MCKSRPLTTVNLILLRLLLFLLLLISSVLVSSLFIDEKQQQQQQQQQQFYDIINGDDGDCSKWHQYKFSGNMTTTNCYFLRLKKREVTLNVGWTIIDEEVDTVIPMVLQHLQQMNVKFVILPNIREQISVRPLILTYNIQLELTNGLVYNLTFIERYGHAYMTYRNRIFQIKLYLNIAELQFVYDFVLKLLSVVHGYGKVVGSMDNIVMFLHLGLDVRNLKMYVYDFRLIRYRKLQVNLNEGAHIIRDISGIILTPITNLFRERVTNSISDNLKEQFQNILDDFNVRDPLELHKFVQYILGGLTSHTTNETLSETA